MADLSAFPTTRRWPPKHPDRLQLYSLPTPNGVKVSIMLEELALPYEAHLVDFGNNDQLTLEFLSLNPNGKIPAIIDPNGPGGAPLGLFESGAILLSRTRLASSCLPMRRADTRPSSGCSSRWHSSGRCSAKSASSTNSRVGNIQTSGRWSATVTNPSACSVSSTPASQSGNGSWATNTRSPTSPRSAGCAI